MKNVFFLFLALAFISCGSLPDTGPKNTTLYSISNVDPYFSPYWPEECPDPFDPAIDEEVRHNCTGEYMDNIPAGAEIEDPLMSKLKIMCENGLWVWLGWFDSCDSIMIMPNDILFDQGPPGSGGTQCEDPQIAKSFDDDGWEGKCTTTFSASVSIDFGGGVSGSIGVRRDFVSQNSSGYAGNGYFGLYLSGSSNYVNIGGTMGRRDYDQQCLMYPGDLGCN